MSGARAVSAVVALAALAGCPKPSPAPPMGPSAPAVSEPAGRAGLVVLIVVDQLPVRLLELPRERYTAGLAKLTGPDAAVHEARFAHAITFTCPGHATISTGAAPSINGIVSNDWWLPGDPGQSVYCSDPALLRVATLADNVVDAGGIVASVALKDRAAVMLGGTRAQLVSWYDRSVPGFTGALAGQVDIDAWLVPWEALYPDDYARWVGPDDGPLEGDPGIGKTFPHPAPDARGFLYTPFAGEALVDAALVAAEQLQLGQDGPADLLALSFSQTDYIGHAFTSESWEAVDGMIRLDLAIGRLLDGLAARVGDDRLTVLLTSDHGAYIAGQSSWIGASAVEDAANAALLEAGFSGEVHFESPSLWLPANVRADAASRARAAVAVAERVRQVPGIGGAYAWRDQPLEGPHATAVELSLDEERSGDVYVLRALNALYDYPGSEGRGTSHGTPFPDDTDVPFLAWGAGIRPGSGSRVDVRQVAPTAAALLGVAPPAAASMPAADILTD